MYALAFRSHLRRPREQTDHFILSDAGLAGYGLQEFSQRSGAGIEQLRTRSDSVKRLDETAPGIVQLVGRDFTLTGQNLPEANCGLEGSQSIASQTLAGDFSKTFGCQEKLRDGGVAQLGKFGKDQILIAEVGELASQQADGFRTEAVSL